MYTKLKDQLRKTFSIHNKRNALWIRGNYYTYQQLATRINKTFKLLPAAGNNIAILTSDTPGTYATIIAALLAGNGFVPISPYYPAERIKSILEQAGCVSLFSETNVDTTIYSNIKNILFPQEENKEALLVETNYPNPHSIASILFTSGSTGIPKGVPMTYKNIEATIDSYNALGCAPTEESRCLQMFEFTFDMSMLSYLPAFLSGACVYSVVDDKMKFFSAFKTISDFKLTHTVFVPSTLAMMRKYFKTMKFTSMECCMVGGEPFPLDLAAEFAQCAPNTRLFNISGPTETTMACMGYEFNHDIGKNKHLNGILAFGKPWKNTTAIVVDENLNPVTSNVKGELCFAGDNVMHGYINNPERNALVFFNLTQNQIEYTFYRTGDGAYCDTEGDFYTCGRIDQQVKIQGYRVEPGEIEAVAREIAGDVLLAAIPYKKHDGFLSIRLFTEPGVKTNQEILEYLKLKLATYMVPDDINIVKPMPLNPNGKIDRNLLKQILERGNE